MMTGSRTAKASFRSISQDVTEVTICTCIGCHYFEQHLLAHLATDYRLHKVIFKNCPCLDIEQLEVTLNPVRCGHLGVHRGGLAVL